MLQMPRAYTDVDGRMSPAIPTGTSFVSRGEGQASTSTKFASDIFLFGAEATMVEPNV
jgi:hypothetical protein